MLLRAKSFTLDGEAVVCGPDGVAVFDALHRRGTVTEAMLYAFDLLELDGEDSARCARRAQGTAGEATERAPARHRPERSHRRTTAAVFRQACRMGLEGIVSKRLIEALSVGSIWGLAEGQEPGQSGDGGRTSGGAVENAAASGELRLEYRIETAPLDEDIALQVTDGRTGHVMPIIAARRMYSPIAIRPIPTDRDPRSLAPRRNQA